MKPAISNLVSRWGLPRPMIKSDAEEKWGWPGSSTNLRFNFNISATAEASDFKFGILFGSSKTHHKITPKKVGVALG